MLFNVITPIKLASMYPLSTSVQSEVQQAREHIQRIITGDDKRLLVIVGPCSIHDPRAALDYAQRLARCHHQLKEHLFIVMRVYLEKPRSILGWRGLLSDPTLTGQAEPSQGLMIGRKLLHDLSALHLPLATEFLNPMHAQYLQDYISWGAIGARTSESSIHRELASGLPCPIGFKNRTDGDIQVAINAIKTAAHSHQVYKFNHEGAPCVEQTQGNLATHLILRGGIKPNHHPQDVQEACHRLQQQQLHPSVMIDCSHGNSQKKSAQQIKNIEAICTRLKQGEKGISGVMIESFIESGQQELAEPSQLTYGQSITDPCIDWPTTEKLLHQLATSNKK